jgi:GH15 family glucan-1,4-alpha-glucosidase
MFAAILDDRKGGRFRVKPQIPFQSEQVYIPDTNVLQTTFKTGRGSVNTVDFMPCYRTARRKLIHPPEIHRQVNCTEGEVPLEVTFEPRPNYARDEVLLNASKYGVAGKGKTETLALCSTVPFIIDGNRAVSRFDLKQGESVELVLRYGAGKPGSLVLYHSQDKLNHTEAYWQGIAGDCIVGGPWRKSIVRSYLALHLMLYSPTGAIVAAPTTSLPEEIGGGRNWDYRYTWLRDASLTLNAFFYLGHIDEGLSFFNWLVTLCDKCGAKAQVLYDIDYERTSRYSAIWKDIVARFPYELETVPTTRLNSMFSVRCSKPRTASLIWGATYRAALGNSWRALSMLHAKTGRSRTAAYGR